MTHHQIQNRAKVREEGPLSRNARRLLSVVLALVGLTLAFAAAPAAQAETVTIGELAAPSESNGCGHCNLFQSQTAPGSPGYVVPPGQWTLTSWSGQGGVKGGEVRLDVFRPGSKPSQFLLLAQSGFQTVPKATVSSFPVHVPVEGGDLLGITTGSNGYPAVTGAFDLGDIDTAVAGFPGPGETVGPGSSYASAEFAGDRVNVLATLERPDQPAQPGQVSQPAQPEQATQSDQQSQSDPSGSVDTLSLLAEGNGSVATTDGDLHCPAVCASAFPLGTAKTITAVPGSLAEFVGWTGACTGTAPTCAVTVDHALQVNAKFLPGHQFTLGKVRRRGGRDIQKATIENPGTLHVAGKGVVARTVATRHPGSVGLPLVPRDAALASVSANGGAKVTVHVTYTPDGGRPKKIVETVVLHG